MDTHMEVCTSPSSPPAEKQNIIPLNPDGETHAGLERNVEGNEQVHMDTDEQIVPEKMREKTSTVPVVPTSSPVEASHQLCSPSVVSTLCSPFWPF
jgi:hypothetical protein